MIYADNAATTKLDIDAFEAMKPFLLCEYGNASQPYLFSRSAKKALSSSRAIIAKCIGADTEEIYFTSGGTESDNWAIKGTACIGGDKCMVATSQIEHHAVLNTCAAVEKMGVTVEYLPVDNHGILQPETLRDHMKQNIKLVSVMLANNEIGTVQPIKELCSIAHENGALFHTDAVQALGHIPVNVDFLGIDMLSASAHKFNGPKGIGFLYVRKGTQLIPLSDGGAQENGMRAGTENVAAIIAMAVALKKNCERMQSATQKVLQVEDAFLSTIRENNLDFLHNGSNNRLPGNVSISFKGADGETLLHRLDLMGICISTGSACDSKNTQVSHVINAIGVSPEYANGTIRVSFGFENTKEEAITIANAIARVLGFKG